MAGESWARLVNTTITNHLKGQHGSITRRRAILKRLEKRGRITFNNGGTKIDWRVIYARNRMTPIDDMPAVTFGRLNRHKTAELEYRAYIMTEAVSKMERLKNQGTAAIINIFGGIADQMLEDIREHFATELYLDGYATANAGRLHGLESMFGRSATLGNGSNGFAAGVYACDDDYAGIPTDQGAVAGTWAGDWPNGDGSAEYDFWSPLLINYANTAFDTAGASVLWKDNCINALRYAIAHGNRNKAQSGETDVFVMNNEMYRLFLQKLDSKERVLAGDNITKFGFSQMAELDGTAIEQDFGVPAGTAYGLNIDSLELMSMQDQLFKAQGPIENEDSQSYRFGIDYYGNLKIRQPRDFVKLDDWN